MIFHQPVLVAEVIEFMNLCEGGVYCDCTVGGGGHLLSMIEAMPLARFIGIDWDPEAIAYTRERLKLYHDRVFLFEDNFINIDLILDSIGIGLIDGVLFDLGVSYHQLTTSGRGFSYEREGKLLMQMSPQNPTLLQKLGYAKKLEIARLLKEYGDVRNAQKVADSIYEKKKILKTTLDLRKLVEAITPKRILKKNLHQIFQALRIWVNDELINLEKGILNAITRLKNGGRILVISYHSGEDRFVKRLFRESEKNGGLHRINRKVIRPRYSEIKVNRSARSAKLRVAEKCVAF